MRPQGDLKGTTLVADQNSLSWPQHSVPVLQSPMLARVPSMPTPSSSSPSPAQLARPLAQVLAYVYRLKAAFAR